MVARKLTTPIIKDISHLVAELDALTFLETRNDYDANDNCIYRGWAQPGTPASALGWLIVKYTWEVGNASGYNNKRSQISSDELKFDKEWDERTTYFA